MAYNCENFIKNCIVFHCDWRSYRCLCIWCRRWIFCFTCKDEPIADYDEMKNEIYNYEETSKIYFADNKYMGDITAPLQREEINLDDIAPILIDAVLATEDKYFYEHNGIVPKAIARA